MTNAANKPQIYKNRENARPIAIAVQTVQITSFAILMLLAMFMARSNASDKTQIAAFGDSLSADYQLPAGAGFVDQLQKALADKGLNVNVVSAAVSGDTTSSGLARLDWSISDDIDLVILELGANDALQGLPLEQTKANLEKMIVRLKERGKKVLLTGMRAPPNMGKDYVSRFDAIYPALAKKHSLPFYPFFLEGVAAKPELNLGDGIHPNSDGIAIIVKAIAPLVEDILQKSQ